MRVIMKEINKMENEKERIEINKDIIEGIKDVEEGKVVNGEAALKELKEKYGIGNNENKNNC
jgi:cell division protein FtsX